MAGSVTFAFPAQALNALMPNPSLSDLPEACYALPFVLAATISYAAAAWAASRNPSWSSRAAAAAAICAFVVAALQGRAAVADCPPVDALMTSGSNSSTGTATR
ncbi:hypothetical protein [Nonomuraea roseoviolacea]|uniref:hypothetical protein n=1 Tax=Nonomuraea roseoviolacea TaxID=103837 RepID=UPI0031E1A806